MLRNLSGMNWMKGGFFLSPFFKQHKKRNYGQSDEAQHNTKGNLKNSCKSIQGVSLLHSGQPFLHQGIAGLNFSCLLVGFACFILPSQ
ncbi:MAG: hypothetical protein A4E36_00161 [Methanoregulaceae archaeon PtaB.Bin009]|nr:MAG: hypothetical protein A4E36_00161 [Methanoregulaceae archaeon PtaB.Bin009]